MNFGWGAVTGGLVAALVGCASGCGQLRDREDRSVVAKAPATSRGPLADGEAFLENLRQFIQLYFPDGALSRTDLENVIQHFHAPLAQLLAGSGVTPENLADALFAFDADHDGRLTWDEIRNGLAHIIPPGHPGNGNPGL